MPAKSIAQRKLMAIAEHHPEEVNAANRGVLKMSRQQLHDFADTKGLKKEHVRLSATAASRIRSKANKMTRAM